MDAHERAARFTAELRGFAAGNDDVSPAHERRSIDRVMNAQRRAMVAMEDLAQIVADERVRWHLPAADECLAAVPADAKRGALRKMAAEHSENTGAEPCEKIERAAPIYVRDLDDEEENEDNE